MNKKDKSSAVSTSTTALLQRRDILTLTVRVRPWFVVFSKGIHGYRSFGWFWVCHWRIMLLYGTMVVVVRTVESVLAPTHVKSSTRGTYTLYRSYFVCPSCRLYKNSTLRRTGSEFRNEREWKEQSFSCAPILWADSSHNLFFLADSGLVTMDRIPLHCSHGEESAARSGTFVLAPPFSIYGCCVSHLHATLLTPFSFFSFVHPTECPQEEPECLFALPECHARTIQVSLWEYNSLWIIF